MQQMVIHPKFNEAKDAEQGQPSNLGLKLRGMLGL